MSIYKKRNHPGLNDTSYGLHEKIAAGECYDATGEFNHALHMQNIPHIHMDKPVWVSKRDGNPYIARSRWVGISYFPTEKNPIDYEKVANILKAEMEEYKYDIILFHSAVAYQVLPLVDNNWQCRIRYARL